MSVLTFFPDWLQRTYPILVDDIDDDHKLASMGSERDVGNTANLNETFEHLHGTKQKVSWGIFDLFCVKCAMRTSE